MMSQRYKKELKGELKDPVGFFSAFGFFGIPNISTEIFFSSRIQQAWGQVRFIHTIASVSPRIGLSCKHRLKGPGISKCKA